MKVYSAQLVLRSSDFSFIFYLFQKLHSRANHPSFYPPCTLPLTDSHKSQTASFVGLRCPSLDIKTLTRNYMSSYLPAETAASIKYFPSKFHPTAGQVNALMQHERLFKVSSLFFSLGTCFFFFFPLTPFCLCVGTFHIQLTTTHPLTHPSLSFQSVLCFVLILFLLFFLGFFAQSVSLSSHVRHVMQLQFRTAALLCALTFLLVKLCITAGGKSLKNATHCSVMRIL